VAVDSPHAAMEGESEGAGTPVLREEVPVSNTVATVEPAAERPWWADDDDDVTGPSSDQMGPTKSDQAAGSGGGGVKFGEPAFEDNPPPTEKKKKKKKRVGGIMFAEVMVEEQVCPFHR
jgi:hypothetical protein